MKPCQLKPSQIGSELGPAQPQLVVVVIVVFVLVIVIFPFVQTPSRNPADTLHIPSRNLPKTIQTPSRHLRDTINTSSRHPQDTLQTPLSHPPASRSFKFGNNQNSDTMKLAAEDLRHGCRGFEARLQRICNGWICDNIA